MSIFAIGINHKSATLAIREKVYFATEKLCLFLQDLQQSNLVKEAVLLSTCNRSELYCEAESVDPLIDWFCHQATVTKTEVKASIYFFQDEKAIAHMMSVASGLDSMILGEPQILGQMKTAFSESCTVGTVGTTFYRLFRHIFEVAKEIRTTTQIGACPVSVASAAVHFVKNNYSSFENANIAIIGAGETTQLLLRYLTRLTKKSIHIVNRTPAKVYALINIFGGHYHPCDRLENVLKQADIVFSATGSPLPIISHALLAKIMSNRQRPLFLLDLAVPRDVDPSVKAIKEVRLFCIDDLKMIIENNRQGREHAATKAFELISIKSKECFDQIKSIDSVSHTIKAYRNQIEAIARLELIKAKELIEKGVNPERVLEIFSHTFINKLLHSPSKQLRQMGEEGQIEFLLFAKKLFALPDHERDSA